MLQLTKKAIVNSFIKLLNEKPLDKITVKNIAEDCGINRNTFYYHFSDIRELTVYYDRQPDTQRIGAGFQWGFMGRQFCGGCKIRY